MGKYNLYSRNTLTTYIAENKFRAVEISNEMRFEISLFGILEIIEELSQNISSEVDGDESPFAVDENLTRETKYASEFKPYI